MINNFSAKNYRKFRRLLIFILIVFSIFPYGTSGQEATSTNFTVRAPVLGIFGGLSESTNFQQLNTGGQVAPGSSTSTNFIVRSGFLYFDTYTPSSQNWRWYGDETNITPTSALAAENTAPTNVTNTDIIKLRLTVLDLAGVSGIDIKLKLQYSQYTNFSDATDVVFQGGCTANSTWCYADGGGADNATIAARNLTDSDTSGTHNEAPTSTSTFDPGADKAVEFEFTIKNSGAKTSSTYFFRAFDVTNSKAVTANQGEAYPSLVTESGTLTVTISGLDSGTTTEGVITDVTTTATKLSFGSLVADAETEAAQRITISTNATNGYQVLLFQRQGLTASNSSEILSVSGSNASPTAWAIPDGASGAYGYHAGDDTLDSGSTRFAINNTYAKLETTTKEIAFSSVPVTSEITDIVFKMQITNKQSAGIYTSRVVYIITPVF